MTKLLRFKAPKNITKDSIEKIKPSFDLYTAFYDRKSLRDYFEKLSSKGIDEAEQLSSFTISDLNQLVPLNWITRKHLEFYRDQGILPIKPEHISSEDNTIS